MPDRSASRVAPKYLTDAFESIWVLLHFIIILELGVLSFFLNAKRIDSVFPGDSDNLLSTN